MKITLSDIEEMTHDELATLASRDEREEIRNLATHLRRAVDTEVDGQCFVDEMRTELES